MDQILLSPLKLSELENLIEGSVRRALEKNPIGCDAQSVPADLLDIKQASVFLGLAVPTLYSKVSERTIPHSKRGKKLFFSREELKAWVKGGHRKTQSELESDAQKITSRK